MIKILIAYLIILLGLWTLNIIIARPLQIRVGDDHLYFKRVVGTGNNLFFDVGGLVLIALSWYLFDFLKWVVLVVYALYSLWGVFSVLGGLISTIAIKAKCKESQFNEFILWASNLIEFFGSILILYATVHNLFGWI
jgi:hypothetical protein